MFFYFLKRLGLVIPIAISVTVVCFSLVYLAPGDPLSAILPSDASIELIEKLKKEYGLDKPIPVQYVIWLGKALIGDLGTSIATGRPVSSEIGRAISNTLVLAFFGSAIGFSLGLAFGTIAGYKQGSWIDKTVTGIAVAGVSVPHYWLGMVLVIIFSVILGWLPAMGAGPSGEWAWDLEHIKHVLLPAITISVIPTAIVTRTVRALVADILGREFVTALRAKGLSEMAVIRHVIKNALPGVMAVMGLQFGYLLGGSILVETVFTWPGSGFLLSKAIINRDVPVLQGTILTLSVAFVLTNLLVDLFQSMIDPRIRRG